MPKDPLFLVDLEEGRDDREEVTVEDLIRALLTVPVALRNKRVWLGVDSGEGYLPLTTITIDNARWVGTDGDEHSSENEFIDPKDPETGTIGPEHTWVEDSYQKGEKAAYRDICVLGTRDTPGEIDYQKKHFIADEKVRVQKKDEAARKKALSKDPEYKKAQQLLKGLEEKHGLGNK